MASFAHGIASLTRIGLSTSKTPLQIIHRRGLADHLGSRKVPFWENHRARANLIEASAGLLFLGLIFYGGFKLGARGQGKKEKVMAKESTEA